MGEMPSTSTSFQSAMALLGKNASLFSLTHSLSLTLSPNRGFCLTRCHSAGCVIHGIFASHFRTLSALFITCGLWFIRFHYFRFGICFSCVPHQTIYISYAYLVQYTAYKIIWIILISHRWLQTEWGKICAYDTVRFHFSANLVGLYVCTMCVFACLYEWQIFYSRKFWRAKIYYVQYLHEWRGFSTLYGIAEYVRALRYSIQRNSKQKKLSTNDYSSPGQIYQPFSTGVLHPPPPPTLFRFHWYHRSRAPRCGNIFIFFRQFIETITFVLCVRSTIQCDHGNVLHMYYIVHVREHFFSFFIVFRCTIYYNRSDHMMMP